MSKKSNTTTTEVKADPLPTAVKFPQSAVISVLPLIKSLAENPCVTDVTINQRKWVQKELVELVRCLATPQKGVTRLILSAFPFESNLVESITKILKLNPRIKTVEIIGAASSPVSEAGFLRFCDAFEYYSFEELILDNPILPQQCREALFMALTYNQHVKKISIREPVSGAPFNTLCNSIMSNPTVKELKIKTELKEGNYGILSDVIKRNILTKLQLKHSKLRPNYLQLISNALQTTTSITDLALEDQTIDWQLFGPILTANRSIKKLKLSRIKFKAGQFELLNIGSNTTLTDLTLVDCTLDDYIVVFRELHENKTLTRLEIGNNSNAVLDQDLLLDYLTDDCKLIELKLRLTKSQRTKSHALNAISEALKGNTTLRRLDLKTTAVPQVLFVNLMETLKHNQTLREFNLGSQLKNMHLVYKNTEKQLQIVDHLKNMLETNRSLRFIETVKTDFPILEEQLKRNRAWQDKIISATRIFIKMILMKPNSFILPVEVWIIVFRFVVYDFGHENLAQFFNGP